MYARTIAQFGQIRRKVIRCAVLGERRLAGQSDPLGPVVWRLVNTTDEP